VQTEDGLERSASFGDVEPSAEIDEWARKYLEHEVDESETTDVHSNPPEAVEGEHAVSGDRRYVPVLLTHQAPRGVALTGVALLLTSTDTAFTYPSRVATELSRVVSSAGDALTSYV
jgi:hypothetical protein